VVVDCYSLQNHKRVITTNIILKSRGPERPVDRTHLVRRFAVQNRSTKATITIGRNAEDIDIGQHFDGIAEISDARHSNLKKRNGAPGKAIPDGQFLVIPVPVVFAH
jgi:hypothetical protein